MIKLKSFEQENIIITWTAIKIGLYGYCNFASQLENQDVLNYALELLEKDINQNEDILALAICYEENSEEIRSIVYKLSQYEDIDYYFEVRKWRALYLKELLINLPKDFIDGLYELTDFWAMFNYPEDSPHIVQGKNSNISPQEYYSEENYANIVNNHKTWLKEEFKKLKKA